MHRRRRDKRKMEDEFSKEPFFRRMFDMVMSQLLKDYDTIIGAIFTESWKKKYESYTHAMLSSLDLEKQLQIIRTTTFGRGPFPTRQSRKKSNVLEGGMPNDKNQDSKKDKESTTTELENSNEWSRVIKQLFQQEMPLIEEKLQEVGVSIKVNEDSGNLFLEGNPHSFKLAKKMIDEDIISQTIKEQRSLTEGKDELFLCEEGKQLVRNTESNNDVVIEVTKDEKKDASGWWDVGVSFDERNFRTKGGISVSWKFGNIANEKADILVNSANPDVSYPTAIGKALQEIGGPQFIRSCKAYTNVKPGQIATTDGGNLQCNRVIHAVCCNWNKDNETSSKKVFQKLIRHILEECEKCRAHSLAMPAIGTGKHRFPEEVVEQLLKDEFTRFSHEHPLTQLKEVKIIVYDQQYCFNQRTSSPTTRECGENREIKVSLYHEHISNIEVDAIINLVPNDTNLLEKEKNNSIHKKGGIDILIERTSYSNPSKGSVLATGSGLMKNTQLILHVLLSSDDDQAFQTSIASCLKIAKFRTIHSVALLDSSTEGIVSSHGQVIALIKTALENFSYFNYKIDFKIVAESKDTFKVLKNHLKPKWAFAFVNQFKRSPSGRLLPMEYRGTASSRDVSTLQVFGRSRENVSTALKKIQTYLDENIVSQTFDDNRLSDVLSSHGPDIAREANVTIYPKSPTQAVVEGQKSNVLRCIKKLTDLTKNLHTGNWVHEIPSHWDKKDQEKQVDTVILASKSEEYKKVEESFLATALVHENRIEVVEIQRIQNPTLYHQYVVKKKSLKEENKEADLFHGTRREATQTINANNFSRSFVRDGVKYGDGVYFARDASYALGYAPPDEKKFRYMYLAKVLVGTFTKGEKGIKAPPNRNDPNNPGLLYDSLVDDVNDPTIYVVFQDSQCYPEYLIKFKV